MEAWKGNFSCTDRENLLHSGHVFWFSCALTEMNDLGHGKWFFYPKKKPLFRPIIFHGCGQEKAFFFDQPNFFVHTQSFSWSPKKRLDIPLDQ